MTHLPTSASDAEWGPYLPDRKSPWNLRRVVHLHRRAGFAATWSELQRDLKDGPSVSVERLLSGRANESCPDGFPTVANVVADAAAMAGDIARLRAWWFYRMVFGPDPLGEKLTLLWHDHFATANSKVQDVWLMRLQIDTLRKHARRNFAELLNAAVRDPALLVYLDAQTNRKGNPNENLARELMELFTLGAGRFSELDVKEAARALTGWTVAEGQFLQKPALHDEGEKTILGQKGPWGGAGLLKILLDHPGTAERIATKLCRQFFSEKGVPADALKNLAAGLREHDLNIGWAVGRILNSRSFFAESNLGGRVLSPVEFVTGPVRALEFFDCTPSTIALADWSGRMGQDLFDPPNVGGWPGGRAWIHTRSMIARANYAVALKSGTNLGRSSAYDWAELPRKYGFGADERAVLTFHHRLFFGADPTSETRSRLAGVDGGRMVAMLLSSPEAQVA